MKNSTCVIASVQMPVAQLYNKQSDKLVAHKEYVHALYKNDNIYLLRCRFISLVLVIKDDKVRVELKSNSSKKCSAFFELYWNGKMFCFISKTPKGYNRNAYKGLQAFDALYQKNMPNDGHLGLLSQFFDLVQESLINLGQKYCPWLSLSKDSFKYVVEFDLLRSNLNKLLLPNYSINFNSHILTGDRSKIYTPKMLAKLMYGAAGKLAVSKVLEYVADTSNISFTETIQTYKRLQAKGWSYDELVLLDIPTAVELKNYMAWLPKHQVLNLAVAKWKCLDCDTLLKDLDLEIKYNKNLLSATTDKGVQEHHDYLSYVSNHSKEGVCKLPVHPNLLPHEGKELLGMKILLPKTNGDLKAWGSTLNICIGGYSNKIAAGNSICFALSKDGATADYCVEFAYGKLAQFYGHSNSRVGDDWKATVRNYFGNTLSNWKGGQLEKIRDKMTEAEVKELERLAYNHVLTLRR
jgi:PcfJ-like protein